MSIYIEKGTGKQVDAADHTAIDPAKTYVDSMGKEVLGSAIPALPSLPDAPTLESNAAPSLPDNSASSPLLSFASSLNAAVNLARKSRNANSVELMKPFQGTVAASDFGSILKNLDTASDKTTQDLVKEAIPTSADFLSVDEAKTLGVPYGTTKTAAAALKITPKKDAGSFDAFTDEDKRSVSRAGLGGASPRVQDVFLNTPPKFQQEYIRNGFGNKEVTPEILLKNLAEWEAAQNPDEAAAFAAQLENAGN